MSVIEKKQLARRRRTLRVRSHLKGTLERPRLSVFRSNRSIYAQVIDDSTGRTLAAVASTSLDLSGLSKKDQAEKVGEVLAERAKATGVEKVVFDRGPYLYHGRVKALAEGARRGGLDF